MTLEEFLAWVELHKPSMKAVLTVEQEDSSWPNTLGEPVITTRTVGIFTAHPREEVIIEFQ
jgi:hypothetical protein